MCQCNCQYKVFSVVPSYLGEIEGAGALRCSFLIGLKANIHPGCLQITYTPDMNISPTQLTMRELHKRGMTAVVVERWNSSRRVRHELSRFVDILGIGAHGTLAIQATMDRNIAARATKMADSEYIGAARDAGWCVEVWGWKKVNNRWQLNVIDVPLASHEY